jgi:microcystin-dependent protein
MTEQFIGEIRIFGFNFAPSQWAKCQGQMINISQNTALFSILGTTFGGNGQTTFALPNLQDRTAAGMGQGPGLLDWGLGGTFGEANHTLVLNEVPQHTHTATAGEGVAFGAQTASPTANSYLGREKGGSYATSANTILAPQSIGQTGNNLPHNNLQPALVMNYCIAQFGVFPSRN